MRARRCEPKWRRLSLETLECRRLLAGDSGVIPVHANAFGTTYEELAGDWWNWGAIEPAATNPILDDTGEDGARNQSGKVWFLAGNFGNDATNPVTERSVTIPTGKAIFLPVLNFIGFATEPGDTEESLREAANAAMDNPQSLSVTVDGQEIDASNFRAESPAGGFTLNVPGGSLFTDLGVPAGDYAPSVADGYWILLAPLSRGSHEISYSGETNDGFMLNIHYEIEVVGGKKGAAVAVPLPAAFSSAIGSEDEVDVALIELLSNEPAENSAPGANENDREKTRNDSSPPAPGSDDSAEAGGFNVEVDLALMGLLTVGV